ncbi:hypothetical protein B0H11DRAFT_2109717 [Mycena galericulata]|nr:hypothetical protein B0H11DRAFT_2109717 [Mycena galericulata]
MTSTSRASLEGRDAPLIPDDCQQHTLRVSQRLCNIVDLGRKKRKSPDAVDEEEMRKRLKKSPLDERDRGAFSFTVILVGILILSVATATSQPSARTLSYSESTITHVIEWSALLERRRRAAERVLLDEGSLVADSVDMHFIDEQHIGESYDLQVAPYRQPAWGPWEILCRSRVSDAFNQFTTTPQQLSHEGLASVRVPALRDLFPDIVIVSATGDVRGRGTPADPARTAEWGSRSQQEKEVGDTAGGSPQRRPVARVGGKDEGRHMTRPFHSPSVGRGTPVDRARRAAWEGSHL